MLDSPAPASHQLFALFLGQSGLKALLALPVGSHFFLALPEARGDTNQIHNTQTSGFGDDRTLYRNAKDVSLELAEQIVLGAATIGADSADLNTGVFRHGFERFGDLVGHRFNRSAADMSLGGAAGHADNGAAGIGIAAVGQAGESGHEIHAAVVRNGHGLPWRP